MPIYWNQPQIDTMQTQNSPSISTIGMRRKHLKPKNTRIHAFILKPMSQIVCVNSVQHTLLRK